MTPRLRNAQIRLKAELDRLALRDLYEDNERLQDECWYLKWEKDELEWEIRDLRAELAEA